MPWKPKRQCRQPGCPELVDADTGGYCDEHRASRDHEYDSRRPSAPRRGYDRRWAKRRERQLRREPFCRRCRERGMVMPATQVDHIIPRRLGGSDHPSNLQSLCNTHHSQKTRRETLEARQHEGRSRI